jgi:hypothetical protein
LIRVPAFSVFLESICTETNRGRYASAFKSIIPLLEE